MNDTITYYSALIDEYGEQDPRALGWIGKATQEKRFEVLTQVADMNDLCVLDVGCGFGDFYRYALKKFPSMKYTGVDINPRSVEVARREFPEAEFKVSDFGAVSLGTFDVIVASGLFSLNTPDHERVHREYIRNMFARANIAVAFNFLDRERHVNNEVFVSHEVPVLLEFCRTLTSKVTLITGYLEYDVTMFLYNNA